jgi:capsule polysaccharide export protein KpsC/LpsZ
LERASKQESGERAEEARKAAESNPAVNAAHKELIMEDDAIESNPLTELYLKKHPNLLAEAR